MNMTQQHLLLDIDLLAVSHKEKSATRSPLQFWRGCLFWLCTRLAACFGRSARVAWVVECGTQCRGNVQIVLMKFFCVGFHFASCWWPLLEVVVVPPIKILVVRLFGIVFWVMFIDPFTKPIIALFPLLLGGFSYITRHGCT